MKYSLMRVLDRIYNRPVESGTEYIFPVTDSVYNNTAIILKGPKHILEVKEFYESITQTKFYNYVEFEKGQIIGIEHGSLVKGYLEYYTNLRIIKLPKSKANRKITRKDLVIAYEEGYRDALTSIADKCKFLQEGLDNIKANDYE